MWCIPPEANAAFVCAMENVLEVYQRPYDPKHPVVCMDEKPTQLVAETRTPLPPEPGKPQRIDYEYRRNGTANLFLFTEPLANWREATVTARRTRTDWAHQIRQLLDERYPEAVQVTLVCDNLNTHAGASLYEAFPPAEARRLLEKLELIPTPVHGSWLNIAEVELAVLEKQALGERVPDPSSLAARVGAWNQDRNQKNATVRWQFKTADARIKLHRLYPQITA